jgi:hypothetical protein
VQGALVEDHEIQGSSTSCASDPRRTSARSSSRPRPARPPARLDAGARAGRHVGRGVRVILKSKRGLGEPAAARARRRLHARVAPDRHHDGERDPRDSQGQQGPRGPAVPGRLGRNARAPLGSGDQGATDE